MIDVPEFVVGVPMRCHQGLGPAPSAVCGALATWMRSSSAPLIVGYFCDEHRAADDIALPGSYLFRRVRLEAQIYIAAATRVPGASQLEAVVKLEQGLARVGALLEVVTISSQMGRFSPAAPLRERRRVVVGG